MQDKKVIVIDMHCIAIHNHNTGHIITTIKFDCIESIVLTHDIVEVGLKSGSIKRFENTDAVCRVTELLKDSYKSHVCYSNRDEGYYTLPTITDVGSALRESWFLYLERTKG